MYRSQHRNIFSIEHSYKHTLFVFVYRSVQVTQFHRRFYDSIWMISDRLGRLAAMLITAFCSCLLTAWQLTQKFCVQAPDAFPVPSGRPLQA